MALYALIKEEGADIYNVKIMQMQPFHKGRLIDKNFKKTYNFFKRR